MGDGVSSLMVQAASRTRIYCVAGPESDLWLDFDAARMTLDIVGIGGAHLVTTGRSESQRCLVVELDSYLPVVPENAPKIRDIMWAIAEKLGFSSLELIRAVERPGGGAATDLDDWLKL